jgi:Flp pilus assembly protein TadD
MPKLTPLQWLLFATLQVFFGFAVFAITRDYCQRHPPGPPAAATPAPAAARHFAADSVIPDRVLQQDPTLLAQLGDERLSQRRYREAIDLYRQALRLRPDDADTQNDLGLALHYAGDSAAAIEVLRQGTGQAPGFQRIWLTLGFVLARSGQTGAARPALERAVALGADNPVGQEARRMLDGR